MIWGCKIRQCFIVPEGNPKGLQSYQDIKKKGATIVTGAGYSTIENAKKEGVPEKIS